VSVEIPCKTYNSISKVDIVNSMVKTPSDKKDKYLINVFTSSSILILTIDKLDNIGLFLNLERQINSHFSNEIEFNLYCFNNNQMNKNNVMISIKKF